MPLPPPFTADLNVLVLAGSDSVSASQTAAAVAAGEEVPLEAKAFVRLRGRLIVEYVLDWLHDAGLRRIWVCGPPECVAKISPHHEFRPLPQRPGASLATNLRDAKEAIELAPGEPALVVFGDHPLTTATALCDFLSFCAPRLGEADVFHGLALRESYAEYAPYFRRNSVSMREASGRVTGLNLLIPDRIHGIPAVDHVYSVRKLERFGRFVSLTGRALYLLGASAPHAILDAARLYAAKELEKLSHRPGRTGRVGKRGMHWLSRQVRLSRVEKYAGKLFGTERGVRIVPLAHGGTAIDVDFAEELTILEENWDQLTAIARRQDDASREQAVVRV